MSRKQKITCSVFNLCCVCTAGPLLTLPQSRRGHAEGAGWGGGGVVTVDVWCHRWGVAMMGVGVGGGGALLPLVAAVASGLPLRSLISTSHFLSAHPKTKTKRKTVQKKTNYQLFLFGYQDQDRIMVPRQG